MTTEPEPQPTPPISPTTTGEAASSAGTGEMKEVLRDAAQALKSLMSSGSTATSSSSTLEGLQRQLDELKLKALTVKNEAVELRRARRTPLDVHVEEGVPTLIDSGATHILRQSRDGAEMASATRVSVTLANDEKRDLLQAESGAILSTSAETQPILPMAELVSAGCEISWKKGNFKVVHPVWGELRTTIRGGCPELAQEQAAKLVNEIEDKKLKELKDGVSLLKAKLEHLVHEEKLPWTTYVERYLEGGLAKDLWKALQGSFMKFLSEHMLDPLCQGIQLGEGWNHLKDLPFPRRLRKRMLDSTRWVVHLPVHRDEEQPKAEEYGPDAVVVNVPGELLTKAYVPLLWGAATGRIAAIVGSTPATSAASELQTMRMARALALYVVGRLARPTTRTGFFWTTPMCSSGESSGQLLKEFVKVTGMRESELNLGKFGAPGRKPLITTTNYHLDGLSPRSTSDEGTQDQSLLGWPTALKLKLAKAVRESSFEDRLVALGGSMKAMTPEKWKEHVRSGHYPARRDCLQCVMHGATGHRHARVEHPSLFGLTVDITGPFRTQGEDPGARGDRAKAAKMRYLLVAKFTIPESYVTGEFEPTGSDPLDEEVGSKDLFDEEDKASTGGDDRDPGEAIVEEEPLDAEEESEEADTGAGVGPIPLDVKAPKATYLLFAEPLLNDKGPTIASAIQSIVLYLQSLNIPVLRFHSDRAAQLTARPLVQWLHQQAIRTSTSTPGVPQGNGAAESAVKELKLRTRKTLSTSGLEKPFWPVAAKAVASMQRARVLRQVPKMIASFGSKVLVKKRRHAASGALIRLEFERRWSEGLF